MEDKHYIIGFKGFDKDLKCRGFQYEIGKYYEQEGEAECCKKGFHFCENPLEVFDYYNPNNSRFCQVEGGGSVDKSGADSKVATSHIHISSEIGLNGLIDAGLKYILNKVDCYGGKTTNTRYQSAATNTGYQSAATNTGNYSAATNTGYQSAATNTGNYSAATNTGNRSAATVEGKESVAIVTGKDSMACGTLGSWIVLTERGDFDGEINHIKEVKAFKVDGVNIKENTFYRLINGKAVEVELTR